MTQPLTNDELSTLIRTHQDTLWSHRWTMSAVAIDTMVHTIQALEHYRDLLDVIDGNEPQRQPFTIALGMSPRKTTDQQVPPE